MTNRHKHSVFAAKGALALATVAGLTLGSLGASASSHREAPNIAGNPRVDGTDLYAFQTYDPALVGAGDRYTTILANYNPAQDPGSGPNYYALDPNAIYEIHVDNNGDGIEDKTFRFKFSQALAGGNGIALNIGGTSVAVPLKNVGAIAAGNDANLNFIQTYTVSMTTNDRAANGTRRAGTTVALTNASGGSSTFTKPMDYIGNKTFTDANTYNAYANQYKYNVNIPGCTVGQGHLFVGQRAEGFSVNLGHVFDLINVGAGKVPVDVAAEGNYPGGTNDAAHGIAKSTANNALSGKNITTIAFEVPTACLTGETAPGTLTTAGTADANHNGVVGIWTTASLPQAQLLNPNATFPEPNVVGGAYTQVSRLGMPLVNELVVGLKDKDHFNASKPINDAQFLTYVTNPTLPALIESLFSGINATVVAPTNFPRTDLVAAFLTGITGVNKLAVVTPSEMLRLNTNITGVVQGSQNKYGVLGGDTAGFPNGRRPGDEVVDLTLRVAMGKLCQASLGGCVPMNAVGGNLDYTDGASVDATAFDTSFPYLTTPHPGAP